MTDHLRIRGSAVVHYMTRLVYSEINLCIARVEQVIHNRHVLTYNRPFLQSSRQWGSWKQVGLQAIRNNSGQLACPSATVVSGHAQSPYIRLDTESTQTEEAYWHLDLSRNPTV
jgi:hypothetical protein